MNRKPAVTQDSLMRAYEARGIHYMPDIPRLPGREVERFLERHPFLRLLAPAGSWNNGIASVHEDELTREVVLRRVRNSALTDYHREHVTLLDGAGEVVTHRQVREYRVRRFVLFGPVVTYSTRRVVSGYLANGEQMAAKIRALGDSVGRVRQVVSYHEWTGAVILYRVPASLDLARLAARAAEDAALDARYAPA